MMGEDLKAIAQVMPILDEIIADSTTDIPPSSNTAREAKFGHPISNGVTEERKQ
jgi:hypothetical protein